MSEISKQDDLERMSLRNSLLVWVFGAVLGWAVAVVAVYGIIRTADDPLVAEDGTPRDEQQLDQIAPAAGEPSGDAEGESRHRAAGDAEDKRIAR